jgi:hypothetical protein
MTMSTRDLWGDIPEMKQDSPVVFLREQGKRLAEKTHNEVTGLVIVQSSKEGPALARNHFGVLEDMNEGRLTAEFYFQVPKLNGYRYLFLEVELPASMGYPMVIKDLVNDHSSICRSQDEFEQGLQAAFQSDAVREIIAGLRTASQGVEQEWQPQPSQD